MIRNIFEIELLIEILFLHLYLLSRSDKENHLHHLIESGSVTLIECKSVNIRDIIILNLLFYVYLGETSGIEKLIKEGVNVNVKYENGASPIFLASQLGTYCILSFNIMRSITNHNKNIQFEY